MSREILAKQLKNLSADVRLGVRLLMRRWRQLDRATRSRIELAAVFSLLPLSAAIAAIAAAPVALDLDSIEARPIVEVVATPSIGEQMQSLGQLREAFVREARVQKGEPIGSMLSRMGVDDPAAERFLRTDPAARPLVRLAPGRFVQANIDADGRLNWLRAYGPADDGASSSSTRVITVARSPADGDTLSLSESQVELLRRVELRSGEIQGSFFAAADAADIPDSIAQQMVDALESEIDFHRSLQRGDRFRAIYEGLYAGGEYLRPGRLLAVEFVSQAKTVQAFWFDDGSRNGGFYAIDGHSMKRAFLRSPLEYTRLSSGFSENRTHPVFGYNAAHRAIDYSAPAGTKVRIVASGTVDFAGWQRGYGNVVEVRHSEKHSTLYAHLQGFGPGIVKGRRVGQGDVVGFVGATGWATGPHLHFEVKVRGVQVNPLTAELPSAEPLDPSKLTALADAAAPLREHLALLARIQVASSAR
ncbi:MAG TPA: M23 family metallopeptidase [Burkholderiaceae bacterium]|nr:M23 family metallopeptidase [Burkholderiaceae bacterium]HQR70332.1 M23 family metallopeptidase [Burkholderiaceae bacterium]